MSKLKYPIHCAEHGESEAAFVCQHLVQSKLDNKSVGFYCAEDTDAARPDAWCAECDRRFMKAKGKWTPKLKAFFKITAICSGCYDEIRRFSQ
jgi:hypothetical protein